MLSRSFLMVSLVGRISQGTIGLAGTLTKDPVWENAVRELTARKNEVFRCVQTFQLSGRLPETVLVVKCV